MGVKPSSNYRVPVVPDFTLRTILLKWLTKKWYSQTIDSKTSFLYAVIEE